MIAITKVVNAYDNFLSTGKTYGTVMKDIALQLNGTPCPKLIEQLAKVHAKHYRCETALSNRGTWVFEVKGTRHEPARKSWERNVAVFFTKDKPTSSKQVDRVAQRVKKLKQDFTKAELRRLVALLSA